MPHVYRLFIRLFWRRGVHSTYMFIHIDKINIDSFRLEKKNKLICSVKNTKKKLQIFYLASCYDFNTLHISPCPDWFTVKVLPIIFISLWMTELRAAKYLATIWILWVKKKNDCVQNENNKKKANILIISKVKKKKKKKESEMNSKKREHLFHQTQITEASWVRDQMPKKIKTW